LNIIENNIVRCRTALATSITTASFFLSYYSTKIITHEGKQQLQIYNVGKALSKYSQYKGIHPSWNFEQHRKEMKESSHQQVFMGTLGGQRNGNRTGSKREEDGLHLRCSPRPKRGQGRAGGGKERAPPGTGQRTGNAPRVPPAPSRAPTTVAASSFFMHGRRHQPPPPATSRARAAPAPSSSSAAPGRGGGGLLGGGGVRSSSLPRLLLWGAGFRS